MTSDCMPLSFQKPIVQLIDTKLQSDINDGILLF